MEKTVVKGTVPRFDPSQPVSRLLQDVVSGNTGNDSIPRSTPKCDGQKNGATAAMTSTSGKAAVVKDTIVMNCQRPPVVKDCVLDGTTSMLKAMYLKDQTVQGKTSELLDSQILYRESLIVTNQYFIIGTNDAVAIADWDNAKCQLRLNEYAVVAPVFFMDSELSPVTLVRCSCEASLFQRERLNSLDNRIPLSAETIDNERNQYCLHAAVLESLGIRLQAAAPQDEIVEANIDALGSGDMMLWAVRAVCGSYGIVKRSSRGGLSCVTCKKRTRCQHISTFHKERTNFEVQIPLMAQAAPDEGKLPVYSRENIQYDDGMLSGFSFPNKEDLITLPLNGTCGHGNSWSAPTKGHQCVIFDEKGRPYNGGAVHHCIANGPCHCKLMLFRKKIIIDLDFILLVFQITVDMDQLAPQFTRMINSVVSIGCKRVEN